MNGEVVALFRRLKRRPVETRYATIHEAVQRAADRLRLDGQEDYVRELAGALLEWAAHAPADAAADARQDAATLLLEDASHLHFAAVVLGRALAQAPYDTALCELLVQRLSTHGAFEELELALAQHAGALDDADASGSCDLRAQTWTRLGHVRARRLGDVEGAIVAYERSLAIRPAPPTVQALALLYESRAAPADCSRAADLYVSMADFVNPMHGCGYLLRALDLEPRQPEALEALSALGRRWVSEEELARRKAAAAGHAVSPPLPTRTSSRPPSPAVAFSARSIFPRLTSRVARRLAWGSFAVVALGALWALFASEGPPMGGVTVALQDREVSAAAPAPLRDRPLAEVPSSSLDVPHAHPVRVRIGSESTYTRGGYVDRALFLAAVEQLRARAEGCYAEALSRRPELRGRVTLRWQITREGRAARIDRRGDTLRDRALRGCVAQAVADTAYPPPSGRPAHARTALILEP